MKKYCILFTIYFFCCKLPPLAYAFDSDYVHLLINEHATVQSSLNTYLQNHIGFSSGIRDVFNGKRPLIWIQEGGKKEDGGIRWFNHFHDPLQPSYENAGLWGIPDSSLVWAQNNEKNDASWNNARQLFYDALTTGSEVPYANLFLAIGQLIHLVSDKAVPAHVRNDPHPETQLNKIWKISHFEVWTKDHYNDPTLMDYTHGIKPDAAIFNNYQPLPLAPSPIARLWDTNQYLGDNPGVTLNNNIGLAEFTNANFFSEDSRFSSKYPHPYYDDVKKSKEQIPDPFAPPADPNQTPPVPEKTVAREYWMKQATGDLPRYKVSGVNYHNYYLDELYIDGPKELEIFPYLDKYVFQDYASILIPRAVGYSAALIDYFFRGTLEITQPYSGGYALVLNRDDEITRITLRARNTSPAGEEMTGGTVELIVKYRIYEGDPFQNEQAQSSENFYYSTFTLANGVTTIPSTESTELVFDLAPGSVAVPLTATDVFLQLIYRGQLGQEKDGVAVGLKDIGEPTPIDIINHTIQTCLFNSWYESGSADAISRVDKDNNGIADPYCAEDGHDCETDVYPHHISNVYVGIYPADRPGNPSTTDNNVSFDSIPAGAARRIFVLTDYDFSMSSGEIHELNHYSAEDWWTGGGYQNTQALTHAIKNQLDAITDEATCSAHGLPTPCYSRTYPQFKEINGMTVYTGIILQNPEYPEGSDCPSLY